MGHQRPEQFPKGRVSWASVLQPTFLQLSQKLTCFAQDTVLTIIVAVLVQNTIICFPQAADTTHASETWAAQYAFPHHPTQHQAHKVPLKRRCRCRNSPQ
eukprot:6069671-Amphidinium_carterae.1